jgi:type I restriction enzyme, S subunit
MSRWPMVPLGEVLERSNERIAIQPDQRYKEVTVRLWGKGVVLRREVSGAEIGASNKVVVRENQFIISRIDARNGASGLVPQELDCAVVSADFPAFSPRQDRLYPPFLGWVSKTASFITLCRRASEGTTNRVRLKEDRFLAMKIPLPELPAQHRIVARIDMLAAKADEASRLRAQADHARDMLAVGHALKVFQQLAETHVVHTFAECGPHVTSGPRNWGSLRADSGDRFYRAQDLLQSGRLAASGKVFIEAPGTSQGDGARLRHGDLMIVITGATVGRVAHYSAGYEPGYVSQHVAICRLDPAIVAPEFALKGLLSPYGQEQLLGQRYGQGKPGLNLTNIRNLRLPMPPLPIQRRVVDYLARVEEQIDQLRLQAQESRNHLEAILPAVLSGAFNG